MSVTGLVAVIGGVREPVPLESLDDPSAVDQVMNRLEAAGPSAGLEVNDTVLGLTAERRLAVVDLLVAVAGLVILRVAERTFRMAVALVAALVQYDPSDARRSAAGRQMLLDVVALEVEDA